MQTGEKGTDSTPRLRLKTKSVTITSRSTNGDFPRFPKTTNRMAVTPHHGLLQTMYPAFGKTCLLSQLAPALVTVVTKTLENPQAFVPKLHVGLYSKG
jgi:hypothetical protein